MLKRFDGVTELCCLLLAALRDVDESRMTGSFLAFTGFDFELF